ncbi:MAG: hypothetical protein DWQ37_05400 [Planctomycetota bacterium]|nr:MAG: hypothetical protein DWQ37_05400 [Planctomycetota bacterium]
MTFHQIHARYGERLKQVIMAHCGVDYVEASAVVVNTFGTLARENMEAYADRYPLFPKLVAVAFGIADELNRRAA